jgi:hypothetical protein
MPASTLIYPGHDYIENNLRFTLDREPDTGRSRHLDPSSPGSRERDGHDPRDRAGHQHVFPPEQPDRHRETARGVSRFTGSTRAQRYS